MSEGWESPGRRQAGLSQADVPRPARGRWRSLPVARPRAWRQKAAVNSHPAAR